MDPQKPVEAYPKLKGQGSEIKGLVDPLLEVWKAVKTTSDFDRRILLALQALCDLQGILTEHKYDCFLPRDVSSDLVKQTDIFLREYSALGVMADNMNPPQTLFSGAPKLHWLWHMSYRSYFLNPRRVATFSGEDFVKHQKKIVGKCCAATKLHNVPKTVMEKNRWSMHLEDMKDPNLK